jgi:DNA modification methylase
MVCGNVFDIIAELPAGSVNSVITSPPYWRKRAYLDADHPSKADEIGQEASPGEFLATMLRLTDALWDVVADDGTIWFNLGDTASGSGGAGGDYNDDGWREGQNRWAGSNRAVRDASPGTYACTDVPLRKSVCWIPELFGASLAYGRNLLTGEACRQWITRPQITWCKPAPTPGEIIDKFREATELIVWASKRPTYYFDLDAVRLPAVPENERTTWNQNGPKAEATRAAGKDVSGHERCTKRTTNPAGAPPLNWWKVNTSGYEGAHFATFPPELIRRPVIASCPPGGLILDCFGGSGTTGQVATGHGRDALLIDLDDDNIDLARERVGGLFFREASIEDACGWLASRREAAA